MDPLDRLEARIEAELQMYGREQDGTPVDDMSYSEMQQYAVNKENPKENLSRIQLLQEVRSWIGHIRWEMLSHEGGTSDADPLTRLEARILKSVQETDLVTSEILQKINIWIGEIRSKYQ